MRRSAITHQFVHYIPEQLVEGVLYVSIEHATAVHRCLCGCGAEVVTPLTPTDWCVVFDGETISLDPSVGNWSLPCRSHYWITRNRVRWASSWDQEEIDAARRFDRQAKSRYYGNALDPNDAEAPGSPAPQRPFWARWIDRDSS